MKFQYVKDNVYQTINKKHRYNKSDFTDLVKNKFIRKNSEALNLVYVLTDMGKKYIELEAQVQENNI